MNAYELADELENKINLSENLFVFNAANMLRQQADRIAHLEMLLANRNEIIDKLDLTTPQIKELSDEEILNVAFCCEVNTVAIENDWDGTVIDFARAILKKASEK